MAEIKLTKNELRAQQTHLGQLQKYLPTLQLKKAMLQVEVNDSRSEIAQLEQKYEKFYSWVKSFSDVLSLTTVIDFKKAIEIESIKKRYENIAGVEVPYLDEVHFRPVEYSLFETPAWLDSAIHGLRNLAESKVRINVAYDKKAALENELREVSIRVNLFEKVLIPRAEQNIRKIKVFLGDQQLAAVSQAKVAKAKIVEKQSDAL
ncbi:MAG: V-type ATP synthase subunit D [Parachlamydiaceae bacterium]